MNDIKKMYRTVMDDHFPEKITIEFDDQKLKYRKRTWKLPDDKTGELIEKGLRYGENPGQEAALYELVKGHLELGECRFLEPGYGMVSAIDEDAMLQAGKHPGKTNLTDIDNSLQHYQISAQKTLRRHRQTQQPLRRGLRRHPGLSLRPGQYGRPHRRLRGLRRFQPGPGQGHRGAGGEQLSGSDRRPGL